jgi:cytochrome d ubiquinol oxidase subunit II
MSKADACLGLAVVGLTLYAVLGGADFGGGFWDLTAGGDVRGGRVRGLVQHSMTPVWEANHVWLIFVLVVLWTSFPVFFGSVASTLYVPLVLAAAGIIFRGTAFVLRGQAGTMREARVLGAAFATSSVVVPFCLAAALGGIGSGRVPVGNAAGDPWSSWLNPTSIAVGVLSVVTGAYLAAIFLAADARRTGLSDLERAFRARALGCAVVAGAVAIGTLPILHSDARLLYDGLTSGAGLVFVLLSAAIGVGTLVLVARWRFDLARWTSAAAVACVTVGWAFAQSPDLLPGRLTIDAGAAPDATLTAVLWSFGVGALILVPSLTLLYRLTLAGRLDQGFEPLDQRFRPLTASDEPPPPEAA